MREHGIEHFRIVLVEDVEYERKEQLLMREQHFIEELGATLNGYRAYISPEDRKNEEVQRGKQYNIDNKEQIKQHKQQYVIDNKDYVFTLRQKERERNKEQIKQHKHQYNNDNKEQIKQHKHQYRIDNKEHLIQLYNAKKQIKTCICGVEYSYTNNSKVTRHERTKKHMKYVKDHPQDDVVPPI